MFHRCKTGKFYSSNVRHWSKQQADTYRGDPDRDLFGRISIVWETRQHVAMLPGESDDLDPHSTHTLHNNFTGAN
ncbi:jg11419 [Pararge aegeria aegeria]|uniref:Jg11419 protein n=1 Tax=Pararge aegeria aegeria TaxID=348720 RepID=A0A8S4QFQ0_9NEOP|nr:jg11419 [Pararge aegeria aegeria]